MQTKLIVLALSLVSSSVLAAESAQWEFDGSTVAAYSTTKLNKTGSNSTKTFGLATTVGYFIDPMIELTSRLGYVISDDGTSRSNDTFMTLLVGPQFNFGSENVANDFYAGVRAGIYNQKYGATPPDTSTSVSVFEYDLFLGKRFSIVDHVTWSPEIAYQHIGDSTKDGTTYYGNKTWTITPFQFSILL